MVIPNQQRNLRDTNINAVANTAENLIQATYAYRAKNNVWPTRFFDNSNLNGGPSPLPGSLPSAGTPPTGVPFLVPDYLAHFNLRNPWGYFWSMKSVSHTNKMLYFETETGDEAIARALVRKIGSSAVISNQTIVKIYPAMNATPTVQGLNIDGVLSLDGDLQINGSELDLGSAKVVMRVSDKDVDITKYLTALPYQFDIRMKTFDRLLYNQGTLLLNLHARVQKLEEKNK
ncbi:MAG: hypothetical protein ACPG8S_05965 [Porticoccaceae bacterium]